MSRNFKKITSSDFADNKVAAAGDTGLAGTSSAEASAASCRSCRSAAAGADSPSATKSDTNSCLRLQRALKCLAAAARSDSDSLAGCPCSAESKRCFLPRSSHFPPGGSWKSEDTVRRHATESGEASSLERSRRDSAGEPEELSLLYCHRRLHLTPNLKQF